MPVLISHLHFSVSLRLPIPVNPKLPKYYKVQEQRASAANEPTRIEKDILTVSSGPFSAFASSPSIIVTFESCAARLVGKDAQNVCEISHTCEKKKQPADPFGAFTAVIEKELGDTRAKVQGCAEEAKNLAPDFEVEGGDLW